MPSLAFDRKNFSELLEVEDIAAESTTTALIQNETFITTTTGDGEDEDEDKKDPKEGNCDPNFPWKDIRLPESARPISYSLQLHPNLTALNFFGVVTIKIDIQAPTRFIVLHASPSLNAKSITLKTFGKTSHPKLLTCADRFQWAFLLADHNVSETADEELILEIKYTGLIHSDFSGIYANTHTSKNGERIVSAVTQFEPTNARKMLPCFDEPSFKARFEISVIRERQHTVLSNMHLLKSTTLENGLVLDRFENSVKMSTYLLAVAVLNGFKNVHKVTYGTKKPIRVSLYAPSESMTNKTVFALNVAVEALKFYEKYFGIPYALEKEGNWHHYLLALNDFAEGAMENWGLTTFRDVMLLYDPEGSTTKSKEGVALVVCHELAHQWFGNLVTMKWWNDLWLNEGFAMHMEYRCVDEIYPKWKVMDEFYLDNFEPSMLMDAFDTSHAVSTEVHDPAQIGSLFDAISYHKAAAIIRMIAALDDEQKFQQALRKYLRTYAYGNAESVNLWQVINEFMSLKDHNINLTNFAETWTTQIGFPYITVTHNSEAGYIDIHNQSRFLFLEEARNAKQQNTYWPIPVYYKTSFPSSDDRIHWMTGKDQKVRIPIKKNAKWVIANVKAKGYYRVFYDEKNYKAIIQQMNVKHSAMLAVERASLINDAFAFVKAGLLPVDTVMNMISYAENGTEVDRLPWSIIINHLNYYDSLTYESRVYDQFQRFMRRLVTNAYDRIGWEKRSEHSERLLQIEILSFACKIGITDCKSQAKKLFYQWKNNKSVPVDLRPLILEEGVKQGTKADWEYVLEKYKRVKIPSKKFILLGALMATTDQRLINRSLDMCLNSSLIKPNISPKALSLLAQNRNAQQYTWRFFQMHFKSFKQSLGTTNMLGMACKSIIENFSTEFDLKQAESFFKKQELGSSKQKVEQAIDSIRVNIQWRRLNEAALGKWLEGYYEKQISLM